LDDQQKTPKDLQNSLRSKGNIMKILHLQYIAKATPNKACCCLTGDEHLGSATTSIPMELAL
jgi:hypothetical protein